jgi:GDP-D-mannose dehydratase
MWLMLQHESPEDFVIATGEFHSVREFCTLAFAEVGINLRWEGVGVDEKGIDIATGKVLVEVDPNIFDRLKWNNYWEILQKPKLCWVGILGKHLSSNSSN